MIVNGYKIEPGADLSGVNLFRANLFRANLFRAKVYGYVLTREKQHVW